MQKTLRTEKFFNTFVALSLSLCFFSPKATTVPSTTNLSLTAAGATSAYLLYTYLSQPDKTTPTIDDIYPLSALPLENTTAYDKTNPMIVSSASMTFQMLPGTDACTLRNTEPLWLLACGWKPVFDQMFRSRVESSITSLRRYLKRNIFHGPSITFVYKDNRQSFNFGQELDQQALDTLYHETGNRDLILYGLCRGTTTILKWLEHFQNNNTIKALILESPALSLKNICKGISQRYTHCTLPECCINLFFTRFFPNYKPDEGALLESLSTINLSQDVPIFIGHIQGDHITTDEQVALLVKTLHATRKNPLYFFICTEPLDHGTLSRSSAYQQAINAFLKKYGLPHNTALAQAGENLLDQAYKQAMLEYA
jgi:hypothetical protein